MHRIDREAALGILHEIVRLIVVLRQFLHPETARIAMRVLTAVIPAPTHTGSAGGIDERDGFRDHVQILRRSRLMPISVSVPNWMSNLSCMVVIAFQGLSSLPRLG